jgi:hypothetical protein
VSGYAISFSVKNWNHEGHEEHEDGRPHHRPGILPLRSFRMVRWWSNFTRPRVTIRRSPTRVTRSISSHAGMVCFLMESIAVQWRLARSYLIRLARFTVSRTSHPTSSSGLLFMDRKAGRRTSDHATAPEIGRCPRSSSAARRHPHLLHVASNALALAGDRGAVHHSDWCRSISLRHRCFASPLVARVSSPSYDAQPTMVAGRDCGWLAARQLSCGSILHTVGH